MPTEEDPQLRRIIEAIANGSPVDWANTGDMATPAANDTLRALRVIAEIAAVHRRLDAHDSAASLGDVLSAADAPAQLDPQMQPDLSNGQPWGPLIVLERIDGGSFGDVFRAWDPALAKVVALKRTRYSSTTDAARAVREGQRLARIPPHPNVITVYGACEINGVVGLWMEFLSGRTLQRVVKDEGNISCAEATHYGASLCKALSHVHAAGVLHRDLKAANVMKAAGGRIILLDFGSGGETAPPDAADARRLVGTPLYMAPEIFKGEPATRQSDIYSLGVLLFNLVTGTYPVCGNSREEIQAAHMCGRRVLLLDARADLEMPFVRVVERAIAPDVDQRYRTAGEMLQELILSAAPPAFSPAAISKPDAVPRITNVLWSALGIGFGLTGLGVVNSRFFNSALGRTEFANENLWDWLYWGFTSCVAPAVLTIAVLLGLGLLTVCRRLVIDRSPRARALEKRIVDAAERHLLDDMSTLSSYALLVSAVVLIGTWLYFGHFINQLMDVSSPDISTAPAGTLAFLSPEPEFRAKHDLYRAAFTWVTIFCWALWYSVIRLATQKGESLNRSILGGGVAVLLLSLLFLDFPYRLLKWDGRNFVEVTWRGDPCFILGQQQVDLLLFCPEAATPRNRIVHRDDPELGRSGARKDIFTNVARFK